MICLKKKERKNTGYRTHSSQTKSLLITEESTNSDNTTSADNWKMQKVASFKRNKLQRSIVFGSLLHNILLQSAENRRKERNQFWLRLHHTVILISNDRTSASKKMNLMALIRTRRFLLLRSKGKGKNSTVFGRLLSRFCKILELYPSQIMF